MEGFFVRFIGLLYNQKLFLSEQHLYLPILLARSLVQPYTLEKYMKDKINSKLEEKRVKRVQVQSKLPSVNKDLFMKLKDLESTKKKAKAANLVHFFKIRND